MDSAMLKPQPRVTALNRPFWDGCSEGRLLIQHCPACAKSIFYPRVCCPFCQHGELDWVQASGNGKVITHSCLQLKSAGKTYCTRKTDDIPKSLPAS